MRPTRHVYTFPRHLNVTRILALTVAAVLLASCSNPPEEPTKPRRGYNFASAVNDASTSYPIVRIVVVDESKKDVAVRCVTARALLAAIEVEHGLKPLYDGPGNSREIALSAPGQLFAFSKPAAISALSVPWLDQSQADTACTAIARGEPALIGDYAPYLYVGDGKGGLVKAD